MKANELRIGNLFIDTIGAYCEPGTIQKVRTISENGVNKWQDMGSSGNCPFERMEPIPITVEILEECGYSKANLRPDYDFDYNKGYDFEFDNKNGFVDIHVKDNIYPIGLKKDLFYLVESQLNSDESSSLYPIGKGFKYLHELQNIYFALTGEELEIKELQPAQ